MRAARCLTLTPVQPRTPNHIAANPIPNGQVGGSNISLYLPISPYIFLYLPISPGRWVARHLSTRRVSMRACGGTRASAATYLPIATRAVSRMPRRSMNTRARRPLSRIWPTALRLGFGLGLALGSGSGLADCLEVRVRASARVRVRVRRDCLEVRLGFGFGHGLRLGPGLGELS